MDMKGTVTQRPVRLSLLIALVLVCAFVGLWHAQEGSGVGRSNYAAGAGSARDARYGGVTVHLADDSLALKNMRLARIGGSTVVKGDVVNRSNRSLDEATFEVRAYDRDGELLRGAERKTIFAVNQLKARASAQINSGYGVWLQGIPLDRIARVEISETSNEIGRSSALNVIPLASHVLSWREYSKIEE